MKLEAAYPIVVTDRLDECRDFYVKSFGFQVVFEASWFVYVSSGGDHPHGIAFMASNHPSQPPGRETFNGKGVLLTLQVADAAAELARLKGLGRKITYPLKDEPWGQRRFGIIDPAGVWVDVVQQIEPAPGFWDKYKKTQKAER
jgi:catechol 2,3-dioxygenase-like lactoylglutathione lyase family enzyme